MLFENTLGLFAVVPKSGWEVTLFSSSTRFCFPSRSKTPPQKFESLFQVGKLLFGFFQHLSVSLPFNSLCDRCVLAKSKLSRC